MRITSFVPPQFTKAEQKELIKRLQNARLPNTLLEGYGVEPNLLQSFKEFLEQDFDFGAFNNQLLGLDHFIYQDKLKVHFIHKRSSNPDAVPLLLIHGWPGCFLEFVEVIEPLLLKFHIVLVSLVGFGWSDAPKQGFGVYDHARTYMGLMQSLEYTTYIAQGGDWGSFIAKAIGILDKNCMGIHVNFLPCIPKTPFAVYQMAASLLIPSRLSWAVLLSKEEVENIKRTFIFLLQETGYQWIQATKPQTLAYGLSDSPVGLLAWILEKFQTWTGPEKLPKQRILSIVLLYWMTNTIGSSLQIYKEHLGTFELFKLLWAYCPAPTACILNQHDLVLPPKMWVQQSYNVVLFKELSKGHFMAMEDPQELVLHLKLFGRTKYKRARRRPTMWMMIIVMATFVFFIKIILVL